MARPYTVSFENLAISDANIFFRAAAHATKVLVLTGFQLDQVEAVTSAQLRLIIKRLTADVSGGTSITPRTLDPGDAAAGFTAHRGTFSGQGTAGDLVRQIGFNVVSGIHHVYPPQQQIVIPAAGFLSFQFGATPPAATDTFNFTAEFLEIG